VNQELYPDMRGLIRKLAARGVRTLAYIAPHLAMEGRLFSEASLNGFLVKKPEGGVYLSDMGGFMAGHIDLTSSKARNWFREIIKNNILALGFSGYLADLGSFLPGDAVLSNGMSAEEIHNMWPTIWATLNRTVTEESSKREELAVLIRSGYSGSADCCPIVWTGPHTMNWGNGGLRSALIAALSLSFSGIDVAHAEIGGSIPFFGMGRSRELLLRWAEFCAFTPVMRTADGQNPANSAQFDTDYETYDFIVKLSGVHRAIAPYVNDCCTQAAAGGLPVMRPLALQFPEDKSLRTIEDQYMLGEDMLIAPVMKKGAAERGVVLPAGEWVHLWTGRKYAGGGHRIPAPIGRPPVFYRMGSRYTSIFEELIAQN